MKFLLIFLIFISFAATGQENDGLVDFSISTDSIIVSDTATIVLKSTCFNRMNTNLILYGIDFTMRNIPISPDSLCKSSAKSSAGVALFFYNDSYKRIYPRFKRFKFDYKPMTKERLDSIFIAGKLAYLKGTGVAKASSVTSFMHSIHLRDYDLKKGKYLIQLVYFAGESTFKSIDTEQVKMDLDNYNSQIFQGCIVSNKISIEIR